MVSSYRPLNWSQYLELCSWALVNEEFRFIKFTQVYYYLLSSLQTTWCWMVDMVFSVWTIIHWPHSSSQSLGNYLHWWVGWFDLFVYAFPSGLIVWVPIRWTEWPSLVWSNEYCLIHWDDKELILAKVVITQHF